MGENQGEREPNLGEKGGVRAEHEVEKVSSTLKEGGFLGGEGRKIERASQGELRVTMSWAVDPKPLQYDPESLGFTSNLAKPEMEKEVGRQRDPT